MLAPEPFLINEKALIVSTNKLVTTLEATTKSFIILSLLLEADIQLEYLGQTCPLVVYIYLVSTIEPTYNTLSPNASSYILEISWQTLLDIRLRNRFLGL